MRLDPAGRLRFPDVLPILGLYRFWIEVTGARPDFYIGEASDLQRRLQQYRTPGVRQPTNIRLNRSLSVALAVGSKIMLWVVTDASVTLGKAAARALDLSRKSQRLDAEHAAIADALPAEDLDDDGPVPCVPGC